MDPIAITQSLISIAIEIARIIEQNNELKNNDLLSTCIVIQQSVNSLSTEQSFTYISALNALNDTLHITKDVLNTIKNKLNSKGLFKFYINPEKELLKLDQLKEKILSCVNILNLALSVTLVNGSSGSKFDACKLMCHTGARKFWELSFGKESYQIDWSLFKAAFLNKLNIYLPATMLTAENLESLKKVLCDSENNSMVTAYTFASFTDDYGLCKAFSRLVDPTSVITSMPESIGARSAILSRSILVKSANVLSYTEIDTVTPVRMALELGGSAALLKYAKVDANSILIEYADPGYDVASNILQQFTLQSLTLAPLLDKKITLSRYNETVDEIIKREVDKQNALNQKLLDDNNSIFSSSINTETQEMKIAKARAEMKMLIMQEDLENKTELEKSKFQQEVEKIELEMDSKLSEIEEEKDPFLREELRQQMLLQKKKMQDELIKKHEEMLAEIMDGIAKERDAMEKNLPWLQLFSGGSPEYKQKFFNSIFFRDEQIITDYLCYTHSDKRSLLAHQGRFYITGKGIYFYSKGFAQEIRYEISFEDLTYVEKSNHFLIFPNALTFKSDSKKVEFCLVHFINRDEVYSFLTATWNKLNQINSCRPGKLIIADRRTYHVTQYKVVKKGFLRKEGEWLKAYNARFFTLSDTEISYSELETSEIINTIPLNRISRVQEEGELNDFKFAVLCPDRIFHLKANSNEDRKSWMLAIDSQRNATQQKFYFGVWSLVEELGIIETLTANIFSGPSVVVSDKIDWRVLEIDFGEDLMRLLYKGLQILVLKFDKIASIEADPVHLLKFELFTHATETSFKFFCQSPYERDYIVNILRKIKGQGNIVVDNMINLLSGIAKSKDRDNIGSQMTAFFKQFDKNGDGSLSSDEIVEQIKQADQIDVKKELQDTQSKVKIILQSTVGYATKGLLWRERYLYLESSPMGNRLIVFKGYHEIDPLKVISLNQAVVIRTNDLVFAVHACCRPRSFCFRAESAQMAEQWVNSLLEAIYDDKFKTLAPVDKIAALATTQSLTPTLYANSSPKLKSLNLIVAPSAIRSQRVESPFNTVSNVEIKDKDILALKDNSFTLKEKENESFTLKETLALKMRTIEDLNLKLNMEKKDKSKFENQYNRSLAESKKTLNMYEQRLLYSESKVLKAGCLFTKHIVGSNTTHTRFVFLSDDCTSICWSDDQKSMKNFKDIRLKEISLVSMGRDSPFFENKIKIDAVLNCCFSIISTSRSLDLQAVDVETCGFWVSVLNKLVYQVSRDCLNFSSAATFYFDAGKSNKALTLLPGNYESGSADKDENKKEPVKWSENLEVVNSIIPAVYEQFTKT